MTQKSIRVTEKYYFYGVDACDCLDFWEVFSILPPMLKIKTLKSRHTGIALRKSITAFIQKRQKIVSFLFWSKRPIYLEKFLDAQERRNDKNTRLSYFFAAVELLQRWDNSHMKTHSEDEWEVTGVLQNGKILAVHIREERINNNRILFLISTFEKT